MFNEVSVYIHIPFCGTRCFYCDFNTFAGRERLIPDYVNALCDEIRRQKPYAETAAHTVYFGGGTPSHLAIEDVRSILSAVRDTFILTPDAEITFECNPCDVTDSYAAGLTALGVNRVSLGMQSADPVELKRMGRRHTAQQMAESVNILRDAGLDNISLDLIYGYPEQTPDSWQRSIDAALKLEPRHISLYALSVEEGSALRRQLDAGKLTLPDDEITVEMYEYAAGTLAQNGFLHYEISNWTVDRAHESRHNKQYWKVHPYYGFGAGAHGWIDGERIRNISGIEDYIRAVNESDDRFPATIEIILQDRRTEMQDCMMLGLRMLEEGITEKTFRNRFGVEMRDVFGRELRRLERKNLVRWMPDGRLTLMPDKVLVANQAFIEFVD